MKIGYARVSTTGQDLATQTEKLTGYGCTKIFAEKESGAKSNRAELAKALDQNQLREGDTLVVCKLDRLARSVADLHKIATDLEVRGVYLVVLDQAIDTTTPAGRLMFTMLGAVAEFERDLINERTAEGRERAKAKGTHMGRTSNNDQRKIKQALALLADREANGLSVNDIAKLTGVPRGSIYYELGKQK